MIIGFYPIHRHVGYPSAGIGGSQHYMYGSEYHAMITAQGAPAMDVVLGTGIPNNREYQLAKLVSVTRHSPTTWAIIERLMYHLDAGQWVPYAVTYRTVEGSVRYVLTGGLHQIPNYLYAQQMQEAAYTDPVLEVIRDLNGAPPQLAPLIHPHVGCIVPDAYDVGSVARCLRQLGSAWLSADPAVMSQFQERRWKYLTPVIDTLLVTPTAERLDLRVSPFNPAIIASRFHHTVTTLSWPLPLRVCGHVRYSPDEMRDIAHRLVHIDITDLQVTYRREMTETTLTRCNLWIQDQYRQDDDRDQFGEREDVWALDAIAEVVVRHPVLPQLHNGPVLFTITKTLNEEATIEIHVPGEPSVTTMTIHFDFARLTLGSFGVSTVML